MTAYALHHDPDCAAPSTYWQMRPGGWAWLACRRCSAQAARRLPANHPAEANN